MTMTSVGPSGGFGEDPKTALPPLPRQVAPVARRPAGPGWNATKLTIGTALRLHSTSWLS